MNPVNEPKKLWNMELWNRPIYACSMVKKGKLRLCHRLNIIKPTACPTCSRFFVKVKFNLTD